MRFLVRLSAVLRYGLPRIFVAGREPAPAVSERLARFSLYPRIHREVMGTQEHAPTRLGSATRIPENDS